MYSDGIDFSKATTEELERALRSYKGCLESSFSYEDYDDVQDMIEKITEELEKRDDN